MEISTQSQSKRLRYYLGLSIVGCGNNRIIIDESRVVKIALGHDLSRSS